MKNTRTSIRNSIATRTVHETAPNGITAVVRIGKPYKVSDTEWECAFYITNIGMNELQFGHGIDGLQALIQAIEGSRVFLQKSGKKYLWEGGEEGETGIPRYVPMFYGKDFTEHLNEVIDTEMVRFAQKAEKRHAARQQKK